MPYPELIVLMGRMGKSSVLCNIWNNCNNGILAYGKGKEKNIKKFPFILGKWFPEFPDSWKFAFFNKNSGLKVILGIFLWIMY